MIQVKITDEKHYGQIIDVNFETMVAHVRESTYNLYRDVDNENTWLWSPTSRASGLKALTQNTSDAIEKAYIIWSLENTILGDN